MFTKKLGPWTLTAGKAEGYEQAWNEDGPFTRRVPYLLVEAVHDHGMVHVCTKQFDSEADAAYYLDTLTAGFDPDVNAEWFFDRNIYGSEAYQANYEEEEFSRMDEAEQHYYLCGQR